MYGLVNILQNETISVLVTHLTVEETTVQERERVLWDEMTTPVGWTPVTGQD